MCFHHDQTKPRLSTNFKNPMKRLREIVLSPEILYRAYLRMLKGIKKPLVYPYAPWNNTTLKSTMEWKNAIRHVEKLGLPLHLDPPKNWDNLSALYQILSKYEQNARILDVGSTFNSIMLPWLFLFGYRNLLGIDLLYTRRIKRGPIQYEPGDITQTKYDDDAFHAISCLSVIEHGVNIRNYFKEISRILKPDGVIITSTDYYTEPISIDNKFEYGQPVHIFTEEEIRSALAIAEEYNLIPTSPIDLTTQEKAVSWAKHNLCFTFLQFTLHKKI